MRTYRRTVEAKYGGDWRVAVTFENGQRGVFDFSPYREYPCYAALKNPAVFAAVRADHGTLMWPGDIDIAPEAVWQNCRMNRDPGDYTAWRAMQPDTDETMEELGEKLKAFDRMHNRVPQQVAV